jgi:hypothetical protein
MERLTDKKEKEFQANSGYNTIRFRMMTSSSLNEFLLLLETHLEKNGSGIVLDSEIVQFIENIQQMVPTFEADLENQIGELEAKA